MTTQTLTRPEQDQAVEKKVQRLRELFADAPELGRKALDVFFSGSFRWDVSQVPAGIYTAEVSGEVLGTGGKSVEKGKILIIH